MDISADLEELGQTDVMVVCAGAKAILDLKLTLEYLETKGVPVLGYQTQELPAFYTPHLRPEGGLPGGQPRDAGQGADKPSTTWASTGGHPGDQPHPRGLLHGRPRPSTPSSTRPSPRRRPRASTARRPPPFLLAKVKEITGGDSLEANIQLVFNNAKLAAQTAAAYAKL